MNSTFVAAMGGAMLLLAAPAAGQEADDADAATVANLRALPTDELQERINRAFGGDRPCAEKLPLVTEMARRKANDNKFQNAFFALQIQCALESRAYGEALELLEDKDPAGEIFSLGLGIDLAVATDQPQAALTWLERAIDARDRETLGEMDRNRWFGLGRMLTDAGFGDRFDELRLQIVDSKLIEVMDRRITASIALGAFRAKMASGDATELDAVLAYLPGPTPYFGLLADRRYEAAWPALERWVGPNMREATARHVAEETLYFRANEDDSAAFQDLMHALYFAGEYESVVEMVEARIDADAFAENFDEDEGWALNLAAYSLDVLGRRAEADAIFDRFTAVETAEHPDVLNFIINRASRLVGQRRWDLAEAAVSDAEELPGEILTDYAKSLIARDRACLAFATGDASAAEAALDTLREVGADAPHVVAMGLQCTGRSDEAAQLLVAALDEDGQRANLIEELQPEAFDLFYTRSELPQPRDLLATHPALAARLAEYARILPAELYPVAASKRATLRAAQSAGTP